MLPWFDSVLPACLGPLLVRIPFAWRPGIGDPTLLGWTTVAAYMFAAGLCARAFRAAQLRPREQRLRYAWAALVVALVVLGVNKQLDLQSLFTELGKLAAFRGGWYANRHVVQLWFVGALVLVTFASLTSVLYLLRAHVAQLWLGALGGVLIVLFVLTRAAWFHHVGWSVQEGDERAEFHWVFELIGIGCIAANARGYTRKTASASQRPHSQRP